MRTDHESLAWAAGFFEGEGCFSLCTSKPRPPHDSKARVYAGFSISQKTLEPLLKMRDIFPFLNAPKGAFPTLRSNKFEHVQAIGAALWPWLSRRRKDQFTQAVSGGVA